MAIDEATLHTWMEACVAYARQTPPGVGFPHVGALVVSSYGEEIGRGSKMLVPCTRYIQHAERVALDEAGERARGSILVTTLEPCIPVSHGQVFQSCTELIAQSGIETVVVGCPDRSPDVNSGAGIAALRDKGIAVICYTKLQQEIERFSFKPSRIFS